MSALARCDIATHLTTIPSGRYSCDMDMSTTKYTILQAACQLIQREGVGRLTLEAVAHEAGVSKGGLLYHFPNKEALVEGMVRYLLDEFEQAIDRAYEREATTPGAWLRAYIRASTGDDYEDIDNASALLAAAANNPALLDPLREQYAKWQEQTEHDGIPAARATIIRLALDGLWFADMFGFASPTGKLREQVIAELLALASDKGDRQ